MTWLVGGRFRGVTEIPWLAGHRARAASMIAVHDWAVIPFFMLIWLAGLTGIPPELREAAQLDGATPVRTFWHIELPQLRSTAVLVAALSAPSTRSRPSRCNTCCSTDPGGPANSTLVLGLLVLKYGFQYFRMGDAAAVSVVMFAHDPGRDSDPALVQPPCRLSIAAFTRACCHWPRRGRDLRVSDLVHGHLRFQGGRPKIQAIPIHWLPHEFQWLARFREAADFAPLWRYFFNSALYSAVHVARHGVFRRARRLRLRQIPVSRAAPSCSSSCCRP